jgi:hypothetical protein
MMREEYFLATCLIGVKSVMTARNISPLFKSHKISGYIIDAKITWRRFRLLSKKKPFLLKWIKNYYN